jgi:hypothetical protein
MFVMVRIGSALPSFCKHSLSGKRLRGLLPSQGRIVRQITEPQEAQKLGRRWAFVVLGSIFDEDLGNLGIEQGGINGPPRRPVPQVIAAKILSGIPIGRIKERFAAVDVVFGLSFPVRSDFSRRRSWGFEIVSANFVDLSISFGTFSAGRNRLRATASRTICFQSRSRFSCSKRWPHPSSKGTNRPASLVNQPRPTL